MNVTCLRTHWPRTFFLSAAVTLAACSSSSTPGSGEQGGGEAGALARLPLARAEAPSAPADQVPRPPRLPPVARPRAAAGRRAQPGRPRQVARPVRRDDQRRRDHGRGRDDGRSRDDQRGRLSQGWRFQRSRRQRGRRDQRGRLNEVGGSSAVGGSAAGGSAVGGSVVGGSAGGVTSAGGTPTVTGLPAQSAVLASMRSANDWFMKKYPDPGAIISTDKDRASNLWTRATYYEGLLAFYNVETDATKKTSYYSYGTKWGDSHSWALYSTPATNADNQACGQAYIELYNIGVALGDKQANRIAAIQAGIYSMVKAHPRVPVDGGGSTPFTCPCRVSRSWGF